jgi:dUTP pyrophosphatase
LIFNFQLFRSHSAEKIFSVNTHLCGIQSEAKNPGSSWPFIDRDRSACHRSSNSPYEIATMPTLKIARVRKSARPLPAYQSEHAAGIDLMADIGASIEMAPRERRAVPTGIAVEIPVGYEGQVRPRSGRALKEGLALINSPGTIDADYRGEVKVLLVNLGEQPIVIKPGDRIAQLIISPVIRAEIVEVDELAPSTRGPGGFGHTGR